MKAEPDWSPSSRAPPPFGLRLRAGAQAGWGTSVIRSEEGLRDRRHGAAILLDVANELRRKATRPGRAVADAIDPDVDTHVVGALTLGVAIGVADVEVAPQKPPRRGRNPGEVSATPGRFSGAVFPPRFSVQRRRPRSHSINACRAEVLPASLGPTNRTGFPSSTSTSSNRLKFRMATS